MSNPIVRLTWDKTNDYFDIEVADAEFATWFVDRCATLGNKYTAPVITDIADIMVELQDNAACVNRVLTTFKLPNIIADNDLYDQANLNALHKNWISIIRQHPTLDQLLHRLDPLLFEKFHQLNNLTHKIESHFKYQMISSEYWRIDNKFKNKIQPWGVYNVSVLYADFGKSSFHKFIDGVLDPDDFELSNWDTIGARVGLQLSKPYMSLPPPDYINYCNTHQIESTVSSWPLGNLVDYNQNIGRTRLIMNTNIQIPNNYLSFSIIK